MALCHENTDEPMHQLLAFQMKIDKDITYPDAQADLSLSSVHTHIFGLFMPWSKSRYTVKPVLSCHSKRRPKRRPKIGLQDRLSLNAGQQYCRMLQGEHSAILSTFIKLPFVIKIFVLLRQILLYKQYHPVI